MQYIKIVNWEKHQSYKDRRPKWIKLQTDIHEKYDKQGRPKEFHTMPDDAKLTYYSLLTLRANYTYDGAIPFESEQELAESLGIIKINIETLIRFGFITIHKNHTEIIQESYTNRTLEERENREEKERERETLSYNSFTEIPKQNPEPEGNGDLIKLRDTWADRLGIDSANIKNADSVALDENVRVFGLDWCLTALGNDKFKAITARNWFFNARKDAEARASPKPVFDKEAIEKEAEKYYKKG